MVSPLAQRYASSGLVTQPIVMASKEYIVCTWKLPKYASFSGFEATLDAEDARCAADAVSFARGGAGSREHAVIKVTAPTNAGANIREGHIKISRERVPPLFEP